MSKIICDVCGTSYPETAVQCPICGCVRPGEVKVIAGDTSAQPAEKPTSNYTHVKGGRFSKANVRKRNSTRGVDPEQDMPDIAKEVASEPHESENNGKNKTDLGLTITVISLLLAIVAVVIYIVIRFFVPAFYDNDDNNVTINPGASTTIFTDDPTTKATENTTAPVDPTIDAPILVDEQVELSQENETFQLTVAGVDESDTVTFESDDESVVTVDENGLLTALSEGEATITVICGGKQVTCKVVIVFGIEETDPTEDTTVPEDTLNYTISHKEVTLLYGVADRKFFYLELKDEQGNVVDVEWRDDKGLCKIEGNKITGESSGYTTIYAVINGVEYPEYSCKLIVWYDK